MAGILNEYIDKAEVTKLILSPGNYAEPWFGQLMSSPQMLAYLIQINYWLEKFA